MHISQYEGDIQDICVTNIQELIDSQNKYHNFIMDISIDHQNKISLLEINDAFSIGAYKDISPETYTTLLDNRWKEFSFPCHICKKIRKVKSNLRSLLVIHITVIIHDRLNDLNTIA